MGCTQSTPQQTSNTQPPEAKAKAKANADAAVATTTTPAGSSKNVGQTDDHEETPVTKIAIIIYSLYGHIATMAESVKEGVEASGAKCNIFQAAETLPDEVLKKMGAPPKPEYPVISAATMTEYDGFILGLSGRYGMMPAQMKAFQDSTGSLWQGGKLVGKTAGCFFSTGTQGGGQETLGLTSVTFFAHQGMIYVPLGYADPAVFSFDEVHGASPYGSGTFAGPDGSRQPSDLEKGVAVNHGKHFATITAKLSS